MRSFIAVLASANGMSALVRPSITLELPTDIVFPVVLLRLRFKLSLRDLAEMFLLRGFELTHEAVREWEERFAPLLAEYLRHKPKGKVGSRWYVDETYLRFKG